MANSASARKRIRQVVKRTQVNRSRLSELRSAVRRVEEAIASGDKSAAQTAFLAAQPLLDRGARRGVVTRNGVSRKVSRLAHRIKGMAA